MRQAKRFRKAAAELDGEQLQAAYETQQASGGGGLVEPILQASKPPKGDAEKLAAELLDRCKKGQSIALPGDRTLDLCGRGLKANDKEAPGIDLVGLDNEGRLAVVALRYTAADATRCAVGDTPLRFLLEGLASTALAEGELAALTAALRAEERNPGEDPPSLFLVGTPRYWELARKRESQKGAAFIHELERLSRELDSHVGVTVEYLTIDPPADDAGSADDDTPGEAPEFTRAWEAGAGVVKVRKKSSGKAAAADEIVEADPSRPPRIYSARDHYEPGDTLHHPSLGSGVVQKNLGPTKVEVLFGETRRLLVQGRG